MRAKSVQKRIAAMEEAKRRVADYARRSPKAFDQERRAIADCLRLQRVLLESGLWATYRKMDAVVKSVVYEIAERRSR